MDPSRFIASATNPSAWYTHADGLLRNARMLYDDSYAKMKELTKAPEDQEEEVVWRVASLQRSSLLLAGLALENALKGNLIDTRPGDMEVQMRVDGNGNPSGAELKTIGGSDIDHDLRTLAHAADIFDPEANPLDDEINHDDLEAVLEHLTHVVRWRGRYPEPLEFEDREELMDVVPEDGYEFVQHTFRVARDLTLHLLPPRDEE